MQCNCNAFVQSYNFSCTPLTRAKKTKGKLRMKKKLFHRKFAHYNTIQAI